MSHSRRTTDNMNLVSKAATNYVGIIIPILATILICISGAVIKIYSDVQVGKRIYATERSVNDQIIQSMTKTEADSDKKIDLIHTKTDLLTSQIHTLLVQMARMEEKINAIHSRQ